MSQYMIMWNNEIAAMEEHATDAEARAWFAEFTDFNESKMYTLLKVETLAGAWLEEE